MNKPFFKYIFALILFGSNGAVASFINLSSSEIVFFRTLTGSLLLVVLFFAFGGKPTLYRHKKQAAYISLSGIAMGGSWLLLYEAYAQIGVSIASLLYYCGPVIVMILSPLLFKERLTIYKIIGFSSVLAGVVLINGKSTDIGRDSIGIVCGLLSAVLYAVMVIFHKKAAYTEELECSAVQLITAFLTVAAFTGIHHGLYIHIGASDILPILILGLLNTGIGCYLYFSSIEKLKVQTVAVCGYCEPLSAIAFSVLILGEKLLPVQIIGAVLIIGGAAVCELIGAEKKRQTTR